MKIKLHDLIDNVVQTGPGQTWVIGDVHGCAKTLKTLYKRLPKPRSVFMTGDYINKGPDSKGVIDFIRKHKEIKPLMGNHEHRFIQAMKNPAKYERIFLKTGGVQTLESFGVSTVQEFVEQFPDYVKWFKKLPLVGKYENFRLSHAGTNHDGGEKSPLRDTKKNRMFILYNRKVQEPVNHIRIVIGHTPTPLTEIKASATTGRVYIDGGCVSGKYLIAFCMDTDEIVSQRLVDTVAH